jgi:hypothetical protein
MVLAAVYSNNENMEQEIRNWESKKKDLINKHPELTEEDLIYQAGKEEELLKRLQKRLNTSEEEIRSWLRMMG